MKYPLLIWPWGGRMSWALPAGPGRNENLYSPIMLDNSVNWFYWNLISADRFCWQQVTENSSHFCPERWGYRTPQSKNWGYRYLRKLRPWTEQWEVMLDTCFVPQLGRVLSTMPLRPRINRRHQPVVTPFCQCLSVLKLRRHVRVTLCSSSRTWSPPELDAWRQWRSGLLWRECDNALR